MRKTVKKQDKQEKKSYLKELNPIYIKTFWISLIFINIAFLFHTVNFMFGDHDWNYIRSANYWSEGAFEGRPLHFVLQSLFFGGHVLPILNNLVAFIALSLSGIILARYWKIPLTLLNYTLFTTFIAVMPLTMVWLFYAKDALINLSLPLIAILGLSIADSAPKKWYHLIAIFLFYFAFASYVAIINYLAVCFLVSVLITYVEGAKLKDIIIKKGMVVVDIIIALVLYKATLAFSSLTSDYNTAIIPLDYMLEKLRQTIIVMVAQFVTPIPFMEFKYKICLLILSLFGLVALIIRGKITQLPLITILLLAILFSSKLAFFIAEERGQVLAEMEDFAFVPRLDFYGLTYIYAFALAALLKYTKNRSYKFGVALAIIITFMSIVRDVYTQKVWKLGFDAEMKAHERIVSRLEEMPNFYAHQKYRILQIGSLSLRKNFYRQTPNEKVSLDLLTTSFTPQFMSRIVYNFYYPEDIFYNNARIDDLSPQGREYIQTKARVWPMQGSIFIDGDIIILVLTEDGLQKAKDQLR